MFVIAADFKFLEDGKNYLDWSLKVKAILTDQQLWDIVELTDDPPKAAEKNDMALVLIKYTGSWFLTKLNETHGFDMVFTSAKIAWDALAAICALPKSKLHIGISRSLSKMHILKHF